MYMTDTTPITGSDLLEDIAALDYQAAILPYIQLSKKIYNVRRIKDYRRMAVFVIRALAMGEQMRGHAKFFLANPQRRNIATVNPCVIEQATRSFFYNRSKFQERITLINEHFLFLEANFPTDALMRVYVGTGIPLWQQEYKGETISLHLSFDGGQKKEGLMAVVLKIGDKKIYQTIFWLAPNLKGEMALWVGALQGSPAQMDTIRDLTKYFFGYRPKNLMIYALRTLSRELRLDHIYAVSNHGFYANNHLRIDRKLKTSLDEFWLETGGWQTSDSRFYELPICEPRKKLAEVESHKRNLYRNRFAFIDAFDKLFKESLGFLRKSM